MYPGGQIGTGLAVLGGDPRSTVGGGGDAAEFCEFADGTEMTSAWTAMDPTNAKTRARMLIGNAAKARFGARSGRPDGGVAPDRERWLVEVRMGGDIMLLVRATTFAGEAQRCRVWRHTAPL